MRVHKCRSKLIPSKNIQKLNKEEKRKLTISFIVVLKFPENNFKLLFSSDDVALFFSNVGNPQFSFFYHIGPFCDECSSQFIFSCPLVAIPFTQDTWNQNTYTISCIAAVIQADAQYHSGFPCRLINYYFIP